MTLDQIERNWKQLAVLFREQFGRFTSDDVAQLSGQKDQLVGKLQERYGESKEEAERRLDEWSSNLEASGYRARGSSVGSSRQP